MVTLTFEEEIRDHNVCIIAVKGCKDGIQIQRIFDGIDANYKLLEFDEAGLTERFHGSASEVRSSSVNPGRDDLKLLYANFKQATVGDCNTPRPSSWTDWIGVAKWDAWKGVQGKHKDAAMVDYIRVADRILQREAQTPAEEGDELRAEVRRLTGSDCLPKVFVAGKLFGGLPECEAALATGALQAALPTSSFSSHMKTYQLQADNEAPAASSSCTESEPRTGILKDTSNDGKTVVIITGANGFLGQHLVNSMVHCKDARCVDVQEVWCVVRGAVGDPVSRNGVVMRPFASLGMMLEYFEQSKEEVTVQCLVHLAGVVEHTRNATAGLEYNVYGTIEARDVAAKVSARRFIIASTSGVVSQQSGSSGSSGPSLSTRRSWAYYDSKARMEKVIIQNSTGRMTTLLLRPSMLLGPPVADPISFGRDRRDDGSPPRALSLVDKLRNASGMTFLPAGGIVDFVDVRDAAAVFMNAALRLDDDGGSIASGAYFVTSDRGQSVEEFARSCSPKITALQLPFGLLAPLVRVMRGVTSFWPSSVGGQLSLKLDPIRLEMAAYDWNAGCCNERAKSSFNFMPRAPNDTIRDTLKWLDENHACRENGEDNMMRSVRGCFVNVFSNATAFHVGMGLLLLLVFTYWSMIMYGLFCVIFICGFVSSTAWILTLYLRNRDRSHEAGRASAWRSLAEACSPDGDIRLDYPKPSVDAAPNVWNASNINRVQEKMKSIDGDIILTGATGFVGKNLLSMYCAAMHASHDPKRIFVVMRPKHGKTIAERLDTLLANVAETLQGSGDYLPKDCSSITIDRLREMVFPVLLDLSLPLDCASLQAQLNNAKISWVIHMAADVSFTMTLTQAIDSIALIALRSLKLAAEVQAEDYIFVSTAYVTPKPVPHGQLISEDDIPDFGAYDPMQVYQEVLDLKKSGRTTNNSWSERVMANLGHSNTYTFAKAVTERILHRESKMLQHTKYHVVRPSIVGPAYSFPHPAWHPRDVATTMIAGVAIEQLGKFMWYGNEEGAGMIPVDMVSSGVLSGVWNVNDEFDTHDGLSCATLCLPPRLSFSFASFFRVVNVFDLARGTSRAGRLVSDWVLREVVPMVCEFCNFDRQPSWVIYLWNTCMYDVLHLFLANVVLPLVVVLRLPFGSTLRRFEKRLRFASAVSKLPSLYRPFAAPGDGRWAFKCGKLEAIEGIIPDDFCPKLYLGYVFRAALSLKQIADCHPRDAFELSLVNSKTVTITNELIFTIGLNSEAHSSPLLASSAAIVRLGLKYFGKADCRVDFGSLSGMLSDESCALVGRQWAKTPRLMLMATHRSMLDFVYHVLAWETLRLSPQSLQIVADTEFRDNLPFPLGGRCGLLSFLGAVFVRRNSGRAEPELDDAAQRILASNGPVLIFPEGARVRDRRMSSMKTGFCRLLLQASQGSTKARTTDWVVGCSAISYSSQIPEEQTFINEMARNERAPLNIRGLINWAINSTIKIGVVNQHNTALLRFGRPDNISLEHFINDPQAVSQKLKSLTRVLPGNVIALKFLLRLKDYPMDHLIDELKSLGVLESSGAADGSKSPWDTDAIVSHRPFDADYNCASLRAASAIEKLEDLIDEGKPTSPIFTAMIEGAPGLKLKSSASSSHGKTVYDEDISNNQSASSYLQDGLVSTCGDGLTPAWVDQFTGEALGRWGYQDTRFHLSPQDQVVSLRSSTSNRYAEVKTPFLVPFLEQNLQLGKGSLCYLPSKHRGFDHFKNQERLNELVPKSKLFDALKGLNVDVDSSPLVRLRAGSGHGIRDIMNVRFGLNLYSLPDCVVRVASQDDICKVFSLAIQSQTSEDAPRFRVSFTGGGTNVTGATRVTDDNVPVVALDTRAMNKVLWVNREDNLVCVEAGITGKALKDELGQQGVTVGMEPDSYEFSTVGGWISTMASGMKRNLYGNIEDMVLGAYVVVPRKDGEGVEIVYCSRGAGAHEHTVFERVSMGRVSDMSLSQVLGAEGQAGCIVSAVFRCREMVPLQKQVCDTAPAYASCVFATFSQGCRFMRAVAELGQLGPASCRLLDPIQTRLALSMAGGDSDPNSFKQVIKKFATSMILGSDFIGLDPETNQSTRLAPDVGAVLCTIVFEGPQKHIQRQLVEPLMQEYSAVKTPSKNGEKGYSMTFAIAYLRDFCLDMGIVGESFETFVPWSRLDGFAQRVREGVEIEFDKLGNSVFKGRPVVGARITQLYSSGCCVYFYMGAAVADVDNFDPLAALVGFETLEHAARRHILSLGGSLSHHHGVGQHRASELHAIEGRNFKNAEVSDLLTLMEGSGVLGTQNARRCTG